MRTLKRQAQDVHFCKLTTQKVGIDNVDVYTKPIKRRLCVSATGGDVEFMSNGIYQGYERYITCYDKSLNLLEGTLVFVDVTPNLATTGYLAMDTDNVSPITKPDYVIAKVFDTKTGNIIRYGLKRVGDSNDD